MRTFARQGLSLTRFLRLPGHAGPLVALMFILVAAFGWAARADEQKLWPAGPYTFSDELGGFEITGVSGKGTQDDPIVISEEFQSATPVTLTIRARREIRPFDPSGDYVNGVLYMRIEALNNSSHPWIEFEFELQEILDRPSVFGDGLSFDQRNKSPTNIISSNFAKFDRDFEPYDRLLFTTGQVDPLTSVSFQFLVTDYTPRWTFYLVQDPRIPST
jgi:hypothetical protein